MTGSDELLAAAAEIADRWPGPAAQLRRLAAPVENPDPIRARRMVLQRIWRTHHSGMTKPAAARLIAAEWSAWSDDRGDDLPGDLGDDFAKLERAGIGRVSHRTIVDDLDASVD